MPAASTDGFTKVGSPGNATTLSAPGHSIGGTSINVDSTSLWSTDTGVIFAIDTTTLVNGVETRVAGTYTVWEGVVTSGTSIGSMVLKSGTDQNYSAGATTRVYILPTSVRENLMVDTLLVSHKQTGAMIDSLPLTTPQITTSINDASGNEVIKTPATASAVNEITVTNAATGNAPSISATGNDSAINLNLRGKGLAKTVTIGAGNIPIYPFDFVYSGCVWSGDAYASTRVASMTAGIVVINGNPLTVAAVTSRTFTASKDVYVDVLDNGDGTGLLVYTDGTTNAASPALAANSVRIAIVVVGASSIAAATSVNQGQEDRVLPIASSTPYSVTDSLGNLICPRDSNRRLIGYKQGLVTLSQSSASATLLHASMSAPAIVPTDRKIKLSVTIGTITAGGLTSPLVTIWEGATSGALTTQVGAFRGTTIAAGGYFTSAGGSVVLTTSVGLHYYSVAVANTAGISTDYAGGAGAPISIMAELE